LDFFGKNRAALDAALNAAQAAQADAQAARVLLASNVARAYFQLARINDQLAVAKHLLADRQQSLGLVQDRVRAGLDTQLELRQSEGALPDTRAQIEAIDEQIELTRHLLAAFAAQAPQAYADLAPTLAQLRVSPQPPVLGADLLARRPEIAASLARVEAATHQVESQRTRFYPDINFSAFAGLSAIDLSEMSNLNSRVWGFGPALHLPIFEGGQLRAQLGAKSADRDAAIQAYNQSVIDAVHEASDAASSVASVARQRAEQERALASAIAAYDVAKQRYGQGLSSQLTVLSAETQWLAQRRLDVDLQYRTLDVQAQLMKSLGGGWNAPAASASTSSGTAVVPTSNTAQNDHLKAQRS